MYIVYLSPQIYRPSYDPVIAQFFLLLQIHTMHCKINKVFQPSEPAQQTAWRAVHRNSSAHWFYGLQISRFNSLRVHQNFIVIYDFNFADLKSELDFSVFS